MTSPNRVLDLTDTNQVTLVGVDGVDLAMMSKADIGVRLMQWLAATLGGER